MISSGSLPNLAQELGGEYEFLTPTKDYTADQVLKMFVNKMDNLGKPSSISQPQEQKLHRKDQREFSTQQRERNPKLPLASPNRPSDLDVDSTPTSSRPLSSAGSGSVTPTMEDRGRPACPSTPPSSPVVPRRRPSTPPNSPTQGRRRNPSQTQQHQLQDKRPSLYSLGYDLLVSACQNSYPWYLSSAPMPANVEASPSPANATPQETPPPSRFNSLKKK